VIESVLVLVVNDNVLVWLIESENGMAMGGGITSAVSWYRIHNTPSAVSWYRIHNTPFSS
jgi:hypothetical protein